MAFEDIEQFRILFLDKKNRLIADEVQQKGTVDHTPVYPREVIKRSLELGATALILVHNHPSGDPSPSTADVQMTRQIIDVAKPLGITVHDHIIIGKSGARLDEGAAADLRRQASSASVGAVRPLLPSALRPPACGDASAPRARLATSSSLGSDLDRAAVADWRARCQRRRQMRRGG